jgi:cyclin-dependent kinase-like
MQNKYEVIGVVGEGAYGIVYKCKNKETGKYVAIKKFKEVDDELVKKTMKRELKMLQRLHHPNVVEFQDAFRRKGNLFLVFEFVEKNLLELLQEHPNGLEPNLIRHLIYQLCKSIKYLHEQNIIHRDIKPENLLITDKMETKLCDFGFARLITDTNDKLTDYVATRWYRAPELLLSEGKYGKEVDYWAIGCIMGELVDGNPLFPGENELDQIHCIQKVLGNLTEKQEEMFYNNPLFNGRNLLNITKPETLEKRYLGKFSKKAISFMKGLLALDPKKRLNGNTVFKHAYLEKLVLADLQKEAEQKMQVNTIRNINREEQRMSLKNKINNELNSKVLNNNTSSERRDYSQNNINSNHNINNNEISQIMINRLNPKNNTNNNINKILITNISNPKIIDTSVNDGNNSKITALKKNNNNNIITNNYTNTINVLPQNPTNITNINIINYNNYEDNHSQGNSNNNTINKNVVNNNNLKKISTIDKKKEKEKNQNSMKKLINKMATSINFNHKSKNNYVSFNSPGKINNNSNKDNNQNNNTNNILDNAYKTFYKKNKEKDIYNIELDLHNYNNSNDNLINIIQGDKYDVINEEEEFTKEEKIKLKELAQFYKNTNMNMIHSKHNSSEKNNNKNKYNTKMSPNKNGYFYHPNRTGYNKNGFHLPTIQKGNIYSNVDYKKYKYH